MAHIILLGDSIFDNAPYVEPGGTTLDELEAQLPPEWTASLIAADGSVTTDVMEQLTEVPDSATHLVISSGGNDALAQQSLLTDDVSRGVEILLTLGSAARQFEEAYRELLRAALERELPVIVCTIYNGNFPDPITNIVTSTALAPFNDAIIRAAWEYEVSIIDLRVICDRPEHYANPIEPSTIGSARIAEAILQAIDELPSTDE